MAAFLNVCRFNPTAGGTTDWTVSAAVTGYLAPATAGAVNGRLYKYRAENANLSEWEIGEGVYNAGILARTTVLFNSAGTTAKINFSTVPQVAIIALKEDLLSIEEANAFSVAQKAQARANISVPLQGRLFGLTLSTAGGSAIFGIAAGQAADSTGVDLMQLLSAYTKTTGAWAVGSGGGALDTGTIATGWHHGFLIKRPDTGVVDVLISLSATAPMLPANYTLFRRIGSMRVESGVWRKFTQVGDDFIWDVPLTDVNNSTGTPSGIAITLTVPSGIVTEVDFTHVFTSSALGAFLTIHTLLIAGQSASSPIANYVAYTNASGDILNGRMRLLTDTSSRIRAVSGGPGTHGFYVVTHGWRDQRGRQS
jgi:hypothetical protein